MQLGLSRNNNSKPKALYQNNSNAHVQIVRDNCMTQLREVSQTAASMRPMMFWPSVTAARMKSWEGWTPVARLVHDIVNSSFKVFSQFDEMSIIGAQYQDLHENNQ